MNIHQVTTGYTMSQHGTQPKKEKLTDGQINLIEDHADIFTKPVSSTENQAKGHGTFNLLSRLFVANKPLGDGWK